MALIEQITLQRLLSKYTKTRHSFYDFKTLFESVTAVPA